MKFSLSVVALVAAALAAEAVPVAIDNTGAQSDLLVKRTHHNHHGEPVYYAPTTNSNKNKGDQVNQNAGGSQDISNSNNNGPPAPPAMGPIRVPVIVARNGGFYYYPTTNENENEGDQVNQNAGGDQDIENSNNNGPAPPKIMPGGPLMEKLGLDKRHGHHNYHEEPVYYYPTTNTNKNSGNQVNQNAGGDQTVKDSNNNGLPPKMMPGGPLMPRLGLDKRHGHHDYHEEPVYYYPTTNSNKNKGDQVNQNAGGSQTVKDSNNNTPAPKGPAGLPLPLAKRTQHHNYHEEPVYYAPTTNTNENSGDQVNQNAGGDQTVKDSNNNSGPPMPAGLPMHLLFDKRTGGYYYTPTTNKNKNSGDQVNQNAGGTQTVTGSNNDIEVANGLLGSCRL